jgi:hypothetical protein
VGPVTQAAIDAFQALATGGSDGVIDRNGPTAQALDRRTRLLGYTIENARDVFAETMSTGAPPGRVLVTTSDGNGRHPVVVVVPPGFDPSRPARVHTHYHK